MKSLATNWFGAVMGLAGLGLACRGASPIMKLPPAFSEIWVFLGAFVFAALLLGYLLKLVTDTKAIAEEFGDPARLGYCATLPIAMTLVAGGLMPYAPRLSGALWWIGAILLVIFQVLALARWLSGNVPLDKVNGGWMIMLIGGIVLPGSGVPLGNVEMSRFCFGVSAALTPFVMGLVFYRTVAGAAIPEVQRPGWFIFLVPPSLIYANGWGLWGSSMGPMLEALFFCSVLLAIALLMASWSFLVWPFSPLWWAFTFPLDAFATAAAHYARSHAAGPWSKIAGVALFVAVVFVVIAIFKSVMSAFGREPALGERRAH